MNKKNFVLFVVLAGGLAFVWFLKKERGPAVAGPLQTTVQVREAPSSLPENEVLLAGPPQKMQVTEISSHGEDRASQSRRFQAPRSAPTAVAAPEEGQLTEIGVLSGTSWKLWDGVTAYPLELARGRHVLAEISGFALVQEEEMYSDERNFRTDRPLVVYNSRKRIAGIVTGVLQVILREGYVLESLSMASSLRLTGSHPEMRMYFVTSYDSPFDLSDLKELLSKDPAVESVVLEVLSRRYDKF